MGLTPGFIFGRLLFEPIFELDGWRLFLGLTRGFECEQSFEIDDVAFERGVGGFFEQIFEIDDVAFERGVGGFFGGIYQGLFLVCNPGLDIVEVGSGWSPGFDRGLGGGLGGGRRAMAAWIVEPRVHLYRYP